MQRRGILKLAGGALALAGRSGDMRLYRSDSSLLRPAD